MRGSAINQIRESVYEKTHHMPNICIIEAKRSNNAFFPESSEIVNYHIRGLHIRVWL